MYIERDIEKEIVRWLDSREIIAIRGPRQSGKTTLLNRLLEKLKKKYNNNNIHLVSFESDLEREKFETNPHQYIDFNLNKGKNFFLFDEVQYIKDAGKILKLLFDTYKNIKIIITGSSSLDLNKIGSSLVGRVLFFELYPFSFSEFLKAKDQKIYNHYQKYKISLDKPALKESLYLEELNKYLKEYLAFGGYPRIVLENDIEKKKTLLRNLFTTYVEKDVVMLYGMKYKDKILSALKYLASTMGNMIRYEGICDIADLYYKEAKEILSILENTYVIRIIQPFHKNLVTELRKNPKIYFIDLGLRNILLERFEFSEEEFGYLIENYVLNILKKANFWRTSAKAEVDFIQSGSPIEVKLKPKITRSFKSYITHYNPKQGFLINLQNTEKRKVNTTIVYFIPASLIC